MYPTSKSPGIAKRFFQAAVLAAALLLGSIAPSAGQSALVINVGGSSYDGDGMALYDQVQAAGATATFVNILFGGEAKAELDAHAFDQVWVFDLSEYENNFPEDWSAIANWFLANTNRPVICDGRIISSIWGGRAPTEGHALAQNYYEAFKARGGGLMLGTDHDAYHAGINTINTLIGLNPFNGNPGGSVIPVDTSHPLMRVPNDLGATLSDDSTPGNVPFGLQPNGLLLYPIAWHLGDKLLPGISTTIPSETTFTVQISAPADGATFKEGSTITFTATSTDGAAPIQFLWSSDVQGGLGQGDTLAVQLQPGSHVVTVTGLDSANHIAVASIHVVVNRKPELRANIATAVEIWWESELGTTYQVQYAPEAAPADWQNLGGPVAGTGTTLSVFDSTRSNGKRFYRITSL